MSSLLTNSSAMTALQTLRSIGKNLSVTQNRIATGERVSEAMDNPAYWSISVGMKAQNKVLSTVKDSLGLGQAILDTTYTALADAIIHATEALGKYVALETDGIDTAAVTAEIVQRKARIVEIARAAQFEGQNLLRTGGTAVDIVSGYIKGGGGVQTLTLSPYDLEAAAAGITSVATAQTTLDALKTAAAEFGAMKMRVESQTSFTSQQMDAIDRGIGQLVDADMNAESARLSALQVQQQLGIQALSIANASSQNILTLFRGG
ncbi:MAG: flagellin [Aquamicrobium sp.]|uniref:flagellin N-terminal helical domain-containing protein n=1 Tax=Aquamicrobium sp. TaxID=1872579 RepID=UPI00349EFD09|nr:flagellin [Aquamicrobium sp.]